MKRFTMALAVILLFAVQFAIGEDASNWATAPTIIKAYELESEKLYLEWQGNAPIYQVYMDGASVANVIVNNAVISIKKGSHNISIFPINEAKTADTKFDIGINVGNYVGGNIGLDLGVLGLDPKKLIMGNPSDSLHVDYTVNPIFNATPDKLTADVDFENRIHLSFVDRYNADEYSVTIRNGNDVNYVRFNANNEEALPLIRKTNSSVSLTLDQTFLQRQGCMIPELNENYSFTVQLRKYALNIVNGEKQTTVIHESKVSGGYNYTPVALWKTAPVITYASQTSDGEITIKWDHDDNEIGCEYSVLKINKTFGIKTSEEIWGTTADREFVKKDLLNGGYSFAIVTQYQNEKGNASNEVYVEVKNNWVAAPAFSCKQIGTNQVQLSWASSPNIETYHIVVYTGNEDSLLRFVDLDYSKYTEFNVPAETENMEYLYSYDEEYDIDTGIKLKFEIYGVHHAEDGSEQKSATSTQSIRIK